MGAESIVGTFNLGSESSVSSVFRARAAKEKQKDIEVQLKTKHEMNVNK